MRRWSNTKNYKQLGKFKKSHNAIVCCFTHRKHTQHKDISVCAVKKKFF